jgi:CRISPR system Cascade subunit CasB
MSDQDGAVYRWWWAEIGNREAGHARALAARLRRADRISTLMEPQVHALGAILHLRDGDRLADIARLLAQVRVGGGAGLPQRLGQGDPPVLSSSRFQRLMRADGDELFDGLRRAITLVDGACNVTALVGDLIHWNDRTRADWCFRYFGAEPPKAEPVTDAEEART